MTTAIPNMRLARIEHQSPHDGPGLRTVVWFAGCSLRCTGCINPQLWPTQSGDEWSSADVKRMLSRGQTKNDHGVTFVGGEPFEQPQALTELAEFVHATWTAREATPLTIAYSGYRLEELVAFRDPSILRALNTLDVLVDGRFIADQHDSTLGYRGSRNQRVLDLRTYRSSGTLHLLNAEWDQPRVTIYPNQIVMSPQLAARLKIQTTPERQCGEIQW